MSKQGVWDDERIARETEYLNSHEVDIVISVEFKDAMREITSLRAELERVKAENEKVCEWQSDSDGIYHTSCGEEFYYECELNECPSTIYCQHCGKKIKEIPAAPEEVHPGN